MTTSNGKLSAGIRRHSNAGETPVVSECSALPDSELALALADDLDAAFESFVIAYRDCVVRFVARMLGDTARAEDVTQDVFVRAYRALQTYAPERRAALRLRSWIYAIAHNLTRNAVRDAPPRATSLEFENGRDRVAAASDARTGPEHLALQEETWHEIALAIGRLSPRIRPAYVMRYLDDLSYEEIARALRQPIGTVKASAHRAAILVRSHLERTDV